MVLPGRRQPGQTVDVLPLPRVARRENEKRIALLRKVAKQLERELLRARPIVVTLLSRRAEQDDRPVVVAGEAVSGYRVDVDT